MTGNLIPAAVLIPLLVGKDSKPLARLKTSQGDFNLPQDTEILLTVRTTKVEHHKGQISFPGGVFEETDESLEHTALRESFEEVGLIPDLVDIVAQLPDIPTVATRFKVRPYVGLIRQKPEFRPNPHEIDQILFVPLRHLLDPSNSILETFERDGLSAQMKTYHFNDHRIWGATGRMLQMFIEKCLLSEPEENIT